MISYNCRNMAFQYQKGHKPVFKGLSIAFNLGTNILLVGDNGTGKSTLGKLLCGIFRPSQGTIEYDNEIIYNLTPIKRISRAYYIYQTNHLQFIKSTLQHEILLTEKITNKYSDMNLYREFYLPADLGTNPFDLSINQAWRFMLFLSTIVEPVLLFIDEIPSFSNHRNQQALMSLFHRRNNSNLITIFSFQRNIDYSFNRVLNISTNGVINE